MHVHALRALPLGDDPGGMTATAFREHDPDAMASTHEQFHVISCTHAVPLTQACASTSAGLATVVCTAPFTGFPPGTRILGRTPVVLAPPPPFYRTHEHAIVATTSEVGTVPEVIIPPEDVWVCEAPTTGGETRLLSRDDDPQPQSNAIEAPGRLPGSAFTLVQQGAVPQQAGLHKRPCTSALAPAKRTRGLTLGEAARARAAGQRTSGVAERIQLQNAGDRQKAKSAFTLVSQGAAPHAADAQAALARIRERARFAPALAQTVDAPRAGVVTAVAVDRATATQSHSRPAAPGDSSSRKRPTAPPPAPRPTKRPAFNTKSSALGDPPPAVWRVQGWADMSTSFREEMRTSSAEWRKDMQARLLAARRVYSLMSSGQVAALLDESLANVTGAAAVGAKQDALAYLAKNHSAKYLEKACTEWANLREFMVRTDRADPLRTGAKVPARTIAAFQEERTVRSRTRVQVAAAKRIAKGLQPKEGAGGRAGPEGSGSALRLLAKLCFPVECKSLVAKAATRRKKRRVNHHATWSVGVQARLELGAEKIERHPVARGVCAQLAMSGLMALRHASAARTRITRVPAASANPRKRPASASTPMSNSGGVVRGVVLFDPKANCDDGIPLATSARGATGTRHALDEFMRSHRADGGFSASAGIMRDDDSRDGNPFNATRFKDAKRSLARTNVALIACLSDPRLPFPAAPAALLDGSDPRQPKPIHFHGGKGLLTTVARSAGESEPTCNEIGKWAGSEAQQEAGSASCSRDAPRRHPIVDSYTDETMGAGDVGVVPLIMERQVQRMRKLVERKGALNLPIRGGWEMISEMALEQ